MASDEESYRAEWATLTGRDVYVPEAIRDGGRVVITDGPTKGVEGVILRKVADGLFWVRWDDGIESHISKHGSRWWKKV